MMKVKAGKMPGKVQTVEVNAGATIADVLRERGLDVAGHELRYNGSITENFNTIVSDGSVVLLTARIKGNSCPVVAEINGEQYVVEEYTTIETLLELANIDLDEDEEEVVRVMTTNANGDVREISTSLRHCVVYGATYKTRVKESVLTEAISHQGCGGNCNCTHTSENMNTGITFAPTDAMTYLEVKTMRSLGEETHSSQLVVNVGTGYHKEIVLNGLRITIKAID